MGWQGSPRLVAAQLFEVVDVLHSACGSLPLEDTESQGSSLSKAIAALSVDFLVVSVRGPRSLKPSMLFRDHMQSAMKKLLGTAFG